MENAGFVNGHDVTRERPNAAAPSWPVSRRRRVAVFLFDGFSLEQVGQISKRFNLADAHRPCATGCQFEYEFVFLSERGGAVRSSSGIPVWTESLSGHCIGSMDRLFVFGSPRVDHRENPHLRGGLPDAAKVAIDACSHWASQLVASEARASERIRQSAEWLRGHCLNRVSIADAAKAAAMSERNFMRRFKQEVGVKPSEFVLKVRLEVACQMLVHTDLPADKIARRTGFGRGDRMAKLFRQHLSMSPIEFRTAQRHRVSDRSLAP